MISCIVWIHSFLGCFFPAARQVVNVGVHASTNHSSTDQWKRWNLCRWKHVSYLWNFNHLGLRLCKFLEKEQVLIGMTCKLMKLGISYVILESKYLYKEKLDCCLGQYLVCESYFNELAFFEESISWLVDFN